MYVQVTKMFYYIMLYEDYTTKIKKK